MKWTSRRTSRVIWPSWSVCWQGLLLTTSRPSQIIFERLQPDLPPKAQLVTAKILIIDDEADLRMLVRFILEPSGYEVLEASTGKEGLEVAHSNAPDLVLLDIQLPDIDGWTVLEAMSRDAPHAPVVVFSAHSSPSTLNRAREAGAAAYLVKPFDEEDLLGHVHELLER